MLYLSKCGLTNACEGKKVSRHTAFSVFYRRKKENNGPSERGMTVWSHFLACGGQATANTRLTTFYSNYNHYRTRDSHAETYPVPTITTT